MNFYEDSTLLVEWLDTEQWVQITRKEDIYVEGAEFIAGMEKVVELIGLHNAGKMLADYTNMRVINNPDQRYYTQDWGPRACEAGLRYYGAVRPRIYAAQLSLQTIMQDLKWNGISTAIFDTSEEAREWLKTR